MKCKRLTARNPKGLAYLVNVKFDEQDVESPYPNTLKCIMDSFERLAQYEDIGLMPEEIKSLLHDGGISFVMHNRDLQTENVRLKNWVNDLQSGMYVNCVYCGHRYGPEDEVPASMADVLRAHIEQCPEHPMSKMKMENEQLRAKIAEMEDRLPDYHPGG